LKDHQTKNESSEKPRQEHVGVLETGRDVKPCKIKEREKKRDKNCSKERTEGETISDQVSPETEQFASFNLQVSQG